MSTRRCIRYESISNFGDVIAAKRLNARQNEDYEPPSLSLDLIPLGKCQCGTYLRIN